MWQTDVCSQDTMREPRQRLFGVVRMDRRHASQMAGVERLQEVKRLRTANLPDENPVGAMPERGSYQIGDCHGGHRLFLAERHLSASRFEPNEIGFLDQYLRRLLDQHDSVLRRNRGRDRVEKRGL